MHAKELLELERRDIRALHYTWIAFFLTFYVWFNMAPLATSMLQTESYLTSDHIKLFLIANVALTIPGRVVVGMALDRFGPRRVFSILMVVMAIPHGFSLLVTLPCSCSSLVYLCLSWAQVSSLVFI